MLNAEKSVGVIVDSVQTNTLELNSDNKEWIEMQGQEINKGKMEKKRVELTRQLNNDK